MKKTSLDKFFNININNGGKYAFEDIYLSTKDFLSVTLVDDKDIENAIHEYFRNRAEVPLNTLHIKKIANKMHIPSLGLIPVAKDPTTGKWHMFDFHNRTEAVHKRFNDGETEKEELEALILVRIVPWKYALDVYVNVNNSEKHTNMNKLLNKDLPAGKFVISIVEKAGMLGMHSTWMRQVFNQAFVIASENPNTPYYTICTSKAAEASQLLDTTPTSKGALIEGWNQNHEFYMTTALKKVSEVYSIILKTPHNQMPSELKSLVKSSRMFGILLNYAITKDSKINYIFKDTNAIAASLMANAKDLGTLVNEYTKLKVQKDASIFKFLSESVKKKSKKLSVSVGFKTKESEQGVNT